MGARDRPTVSSTALKGSEGCEAHGRLVHRQLGLSSPRTRAPHLLEPVGLC